jgi:nitric oxide reductase subunit B
VAHFIGDTIFAIGILALGWFVVGLKTGWSLKDEPEESMQLVPEEEEALAAST